MSDHDLQALAAAVLDRLTTALPAAEAAVSVDRTELALTRFANSAIHQNVAEDAVTASIQVHHAGRTVQTGTTVVDASGLDAFVARTVEAVASGPLDPGWAGVAPPVPVAPPPSATGRSTPAERADTVAAFVAAAVGGDTATVHTAGYCRDGQTARAFVNTAGHAVQMTTAAVAFDGIARCRADDGSIADGVTRVAVPTIADLDAAVLGARAGAKARRAGGGRELPPQRYEVVLEPTAVADLIEGLALFGFNGRAVTQRQSFAELGTAQFDPSLTIVDRPLDNGWTFDAEGTPTENRTFVDRGVTSTIAYDRRNAKVAGTESTGHGVGQSNFGAIPIFLGIDPGADDGPAPTDHDPLIDPSAAALVANVSDGILVSDYWYTRVLDPKALTRTGLTRNGVWRIHNGEVVEPLSNLRFTESYPAALGPGKVLGVGPTATAIHDSWNEVQWSAPALHLAAWNFTGGASG